MSSGLDRGRMREAPPTRFRRPPGFVQNSGRSRKHTERNWRSRRRGINSCTSATPKSTRTPPRTSRVWRWRSWRTGCAPHRRIWCSAASSPPTPRTPWLHPPWAGERGTFTGISWNVGRRIRTGRISLTWTCIVDSSKFLDFPTTILDLINSSAIFDKFLFGILFSMLSSNEGVVSDIFFFTVAKTAIVAFKLWSKLDFLYSFGSIFQFIVPPPPLCVSQRFRAYLLLLSIIGVFESSMKTC